MQQHDGRGDRGEERLGQGRVGGAQRDVAVTEAGVQLDRQAGVDTGPQHVPQQHRVGQPATGTQPVAGGPPDLDPGRAGRRDRQPVPVRDDRFHRHRAGEPGRQGIDEGRREPGRVDGADHPLGHRLQPDHLAHRRARQLGKRAEVHERAGKAGVDKQRRQPGGAQQRGGRRPPTQRCPPREVLLDRRGRGQAEHRRTPAAYREPELTVQIGHSGGRRQVRLRARQLERRPVQVRRQYRVAVPVD